MVLVQVGFCCSADVPGSLDLSMAFKLKSAIPVFLNASLTLAGEKISSMVWDYMIFPSCVGVKLTLAFKGPLILIKS